MDGLFYISNWIREAKSKKFNEKIQTKFLREIEQKHPSSLGASVSFRGDEATSCAEEIASPPSSFAKTARSIVCGNNSKVFNNKRIIFLQIMFLKIIANGF